MQGASWIALLRRIPVNYHDCLVVVTNMGLEVAIQAIVRMEFEYLVIRGRVMGTSDAGRVVILPYDQITFICFARRMLDPGIQALFGSGEMFAMAAPLAAAPAEAPPSASSEATPATAAALIPAPVVETKEPPANGLEVAKPAPVSKSVLLARLRQRLGGDGK